MFGGSSSIAGSLSGSKSKTKTSTQSTSLTRNKAYSDEILAQLESLLGDSISNLGSSTVSQDMINRITSGDAFDNSAIKAEATRQYQNAVGQANQSFINQAGSDANSLASALISDNAAVAAGQLAASFQEMDNSLLGSEIDALSGALGLRNEESEEALRLAQILFGANSTSQTDASSTSTSRTSGMNWSGSQSATSKFGF